MLDQFNVIRVKFIDSIMEVQTAIEGTCPKISDLTIPFEDLAGFESYRGVAVAVELSSQLGVPIEEIAFVDAKTRRSRTVGEIVAILVREIGPKLFGHADSKLSSRSA
jgi:hypothetical protein